MTFRSCGLWLGTGWLSLVQSLVPLLTGGGTALIEKSGISLLLGVTGVVLEVRET